MKLALFDLDNTLIKGDSDYLWGRFLIEEEKLDGAWYEQENSRYYHEYQQGQLDIYAFLRFALAPLISHDRRLLESLRKRFITEWITPLILPAAYNLLDQHRIAGDTLLMITATNRFITAPIADLFKVDYLIATDPEEKDGQYTGEVSGIPCFQKGKVIRFEAWLAQQGITDKETWFYTDSHNDLPLLEQVDHPVVVDPDPVLRSMAEINHWPIISLRN